VALLANFIAAGVGDVLLDDKGIYIGHVDVSTAWIAVGRTVLVHPTYAALLVRALSFHLILAQAGFGTGGGGLSFGAGDAETIDGEEGLAEGGERRGLLVLQTADADAVGAIAERVGETSKVRGTIFARFAGHFAEVLVAEKSCVTVQVGGTAGVLSPTHTLAVGAVL
jgi:hypothetical protein